MLKGYVELLEEIKQIILSGEEKYTQAAKEQAKIDKKQADADSIAAALLGMFGEAPEESGLYEEESSRLQETIAENERYHNQQSLVRHIDLLMSDKGFPETDITMLKNIYRKADAKLRHMVGVVALASYEKQLRKGYRNREDLLAQADAIDHHLQSGDAVGTKKNLWRGQWAMCYYYAFVSTAEEGLNKTTSRSYFEKAANGIGRYKNEIMDEKISVEDAFEVEYSIRHATKTKSLLKMIEVLQAQNTNIKGYHVNKYRQKLIQTIFTTAAQEEYDLSAYRGDIIMLATLSDMRYGVEAYTKYESDYARTRHKRIQEERERRQKEEAERIRAEEERRKAEENRKRKEQERIEAERLAREKALAEEERARKLADRHRRIDAVRPDIKKWLHEDKIHLELCNAEWLAKDPTGDLLNLEKSMDTMLTTHIDDADWEWSQDTLKSWIKSYYRNRAKKLQNIADKRHSEYLNSQRKAVMSSYNEGIDAYIQREIKEIPRYSLDNTVEAYRERFAAYKEGPETRNFLGVLSRKRNTVGELTDDEWRRILDFLEEKVKKDCEAEQEAERKSIVYFSAKQYRIPWAIAFYVLMVVSGGIGICDSLAQLHVYNFKDSVFPFLVHMVEMGTVFGIGVYCDVYYHAKKVLGKITPSYYVAHGTFSAVLTGILLVILLMGGNSIKVLLWKLVYAVMLMGCSFLAIWMADRKVQKQKDQKKQKK